MNERIITRICHLEELAKAAKQAESYLYISMSNTKIKIISMGTGRSVEFEAKTPLDAVELVETHILKKTPEHVTLSCGFENIFDLYPEYEAIFYEYAPISCGGLTSGDYYKNLNGLSLKHLILFDHVYTWGRDTMSNHEKGIIYSEEDFMRMLPDEAELFNALLDIVTKEQNWRETSDRYKPDTEGVSYGNMRYGKQA